jgi:hypothetical protein
MTTARIARLMALWRARRIETEEARRDLARTLSEAAVLDARLARIATDIAEARAAPAPEDREGFTMWLHGRLREQEHLAPERAAVEARTAAAQAVLARRKRGESGVEDAVAAAQAEERRIAETRAQAALEDMVRFGRRG